VIIQHLELINFRNYMASTIQLTSGVTAVVGNNGQGKTNLVEALAFLATLKSFRGVATDALIRTGSPTAVLRAMVLHTDGREALIETEIVREGRNRSLLNKQKLTRTRDLLGVLRVTVFSPEDLEIVKDAPSERREFIDDAMVLLTPKLDALCTETEKVLRQRNALLKQSAGRITTDISTTLDVWDTKLADLGTRLGDERARVIASMSPRVARAYEDLAERATPIELRYDPDWRRIGLATELTRCRVDDIRRGSSTVGPHRDDIDLLINGLPARTHASQGEQRTLALAMRLAVHRMMTEEYGSPPVLILDDVLSELDPYRAAALLRHFPDGQVLITTAGYLPDTAHPDRIVRIANGAVVADSAEPSSAEG